MWVETLDEMERSLEPGIDAKSADKLEALSAEAASHTAERELESQRKQLEVLEQEVHRAAARLERSRRELQVSPDALRDVVQIGLGLSGAEPLSPGPDMGDGRPSYLLPELDSSWQVTLDTLRPPRGRDEAFWEWRQKPPQPVTFEPLERLTQEAEQLHLGHPVVRRILDRFLAQGYSAHDLSRVSGVVVPGESVARVLAYARLTLFGPGAARLHDELLVSVAPWPTRAEAVTPYKNAATALKAREVSEAALTGGGAPLGSKVAARVLPQVATLYAKLWPHLQAEADAHSIAAKTGLSRRARKESEELRELLTRQRQAIGAAKQELRQTTLFEVKDKVQKRQVQLDLEHMEAREQAIARELEEEPRAVEALYAVSMTRLSPVGLVVAWPEALT